MENMKDKVVFGGIYAASPVSIRSGSDRINSFDPYDQHYGTFVPVFNEKTSEVRMVDTYKISMYGNYEKAIEEFKSYSEKGSWIISKAYCDYYYNTSPVVTENNINLFKFLGNLEDFKEVSSEEFSEYNSEDKMGNIKLGFEWKYPRGSYLVRKGAKKSQIKILECTNYKIADCIRIGNIYKNIDDFESKIKEYEKTENVDEERLENFKNTLVKARKYLELRKEYEEFCDELRNKGE